MFVAIRLEHRGGGHTFRTPTPAPSVLGFLQVAGDSVRLVAATRSPDLPVGPRASVPVRWVGDYA